MNTFYNKISNSWQQSNSLLCVGLDPDVGKLPPSIAAGREPLFEFNREIIRATGPLCCAFKPQVAYYAAVGAESQLEKTIEFIKLEFPEIPVILDAKRGDIGSTAQMYAKEAFERYQVDAVTVNPYMGGDTIIPFTSYHDRGVVILCRTSNPGSGDFQELKSGNAEIFKHVAQRAANEWNENNNVALVVGATFPGVISEIRDIVGDMPLLIPGVGAQGGDLDAVLENGLDSQNRGLLINMSRSIIYAGSGNNFADAAANEAERVNGLVNRFRQNRN
jgi:orotidine-5'-phosphate decarboxylase